jgi:nitrate reductase (cytochrome), electron transfer subunit
MRSYPEQPPIIPHSIEGYQLSLATPTAAWSATAGVHPARGRADDQLHPLHGPGRQMLADVAPRRYFCTACHVQQTDARPLVDNVYRDMLLCRSAGSE